MLITIDTRSHTTGNAVQLENLIQEVDGTPVSFIESMEELDRGDIEECGWDGS